MDKPLFSTVISVRIGDINFGGHAGNDAILAIIHEARVQLLAAHGYDELDAGGSSLIMADVMIAYKGEAFYGDALHIDVYAEEVTARSFDLLYHLYTLKENVKKDIAHAKTGMACFDYTTRRLAAMGAALAEILSPGGSAPGI